MIGRNDKRTLHRGGGKEEDFCAKSRGIGGRAAAVDGDWELVSGVVHSVSWGLGLEGWMDKVGT